MIEKIKFRLRKIMFTKRALAFSILLIIGGIFLYAQPAKAFLDIPFNIASMQLDSLDFVDNSILRLLVALVLWVGESATFLFISANLLDWASSLPVGLDNLVVNTGWSFVSGITNMFFILIFIFIAISYILKIDTFGMKKALPRLIIIAFLMNFSLVMVKMMSDIGWIFQNSLVNSLFVEVEGGGQGLAAMAMQPLKDSGVALIGLIAAIPLGYLTLAAIPVPFLSVAGSVAIAALVLAGEAFFGILTQPILLIIFNFVTGLTFLAYAILFLIRIGVIWLLAIMAPLAFMSFILPQTQKFFDQWLRTLFQWVFLGVVAFFIMGLGIRLFHVAAQEGSMVIPGKLGGFGFPGAYYKYIFLLIYLIVGLGFIKKFIPAGADVAWSWGKMAITGGTAAVGALGARTLLGAKAVAESRKKEERAWAAHYYPGLSLQEARQQWKANTSRWQRLTTAPGRFGRAVAGGLAAASKPNSVKEGIWSALRDSAKIGFEAARKKPKKKKPKKTKQCVNGHWTDADDTFCPQCGTIFP